MNKSTFAIKMLFYFLYTVILQYFLQHFFTVFKTIICVASVSYQANKENAVFVSSPPVFVLLFPLVSPRRRHLI